MLSKLASLNCHAFLNTDDTYIRCERQALELVMCERAATSEGKPCHDRVKCTHFYFRFHATHAAKQPSVRERKSCGGGAKCILFSMYRLLHALQTPSVLCTHSRLTRCLVLGAPIRRMRPASFTNQNATKKSEENRGDDEQDVAASHEISDSIGFSRGRN